MRQASGSDMPASHNPTTALIAGSLEAEPFSVSASRIHCRYRFDFR